MPLPSQWCGDDRPDHPAIRYLHRIFDFESGIDEDYARRVVAGYCALITHVDEQIGRVLDEVSVLNLTDRTNIIYTSDHGEAAGHHGIFGKNSLHEHSTRVPMIWAGPGIPADAVSSTPCSHVDLFPTILETMGIEVSDEDKTLTGQSLWGLLEEENPEREVLTEFHAWGSKNSSFALRSCQWKLIYHVDMPNQLFDLELDPQETNNLLEENPEHLSAKALELKLRELLDPEKIDALSKADQSDWIKKYGGEAEIRKADVILYTPVPGRKAGLE